MLEKQVKIKFLGTGTSHGVPMIGCDCKTCLSMEPKNKRTNSSLLISVEDKNILIDCGRDFREQAIRERLHNIDHVLLTHNHFDHIAGIDDLRVFNKKQNQSIPVYGKKEHLDYIRTYIFHYLFGDAIQKGGGISDITLNPVNEEITLSGITFETLPVMHGKMEILGYKFLNIAYISDVSDVPEETLARLQGLDCLIIDALRFTPHTTHFNLRDALRVVEIVSPKKTYLTHICHDFYHDEVNLMLNDTQSSYYTQHDVELAYDGLSIDINL